MGEAAETPRNARGLIGDTFGLYRRYPLLFLAFAAAVLLPYDLVLLALTGSGPLTRKATDFGTEMLLTGLDLFFVEALISALHVHAVALVREGVEPSILPVAKRGLRVLPVVGAATIVATLGMFVGALVIVGIILVVRWAVVPQVAAIEQEGWLPALRRSWELTESRYRHVLALLGLSFLVAGTVPFALGLLLRDESTTPLNFAGGIALQTASYSFMALATALLYYDLRVRHRGWAAAASGGSDEVPYGGPSGDVGSPPSPSEARQASWDPRVYTDPERPSGWYVVPTDPGRMRYWQAGEEPTWHRRSVGTPRKVRRDWEREVGLRKPAG
ncbi:MAG TPA: hypothetical protein VHA54_10440 [Solirubrobacterales bacterium]|nr:hypothetical protein [Solirubrobacterales bacterium]